MATPTITTPKGIDIPIQRLQNRFTSSLWTGDTYNSYGRAVVIDGVPKVFDPASVNNSYIDMLTNDRDSHSFVTVESTEQSMTNTFESEIRIYFLVRLDDLSALSTRAEQEIIDDVWAYLRYEPYGIRVNSVVTGIETLADFEGVKTIDDMQPLFAFRFDCTCKFQHNGVC